MLKQLDSTGVKPEDFEGSGSRLDKAIKVKYVKPDLKKAKGIVLLCRSDLMMAAVQLIQKGGENNLHSHTAMDGLWFVLNGRARFYCSEHEVFAEIGQHEGVFIPRGVKYWFESVGEEMLELMQVEAFAQGIEARRTDYVPKRASQEGGFEMHEWQ